MSFKAPFLTHTDIEKAASQFLKSYHPSLDLPIPIEHIIEFDLNLDIIPMENLYKIMRLSGFLSLSRNAIYIDEYQYDNFIEKYRFTLSHEVGHYVLHQDFYESLEFESIEEYKRLLVSIPSRELHWFESQGDNFAGRVLVPTAQLERKCLELLDANNNDIPNRYTSPQYFWAYASNELAEMFEVNPMVVEIRIKNEGFDVKFGKYFR